MSVYFESMFDQKCIKISNKIVDLNFESAPDELIDTEFIVIIGVICIQRLNLWPGNKIRSVILQEGLQEINVMNNIHVINLDIPSSVVKCKHISISGTHKNTNIMFHNDNFMNFDDNFVDFDRINKLEFSTTDLEPKFKKRFLIN